MVRRLSEERVRELAEDIWTASSGRVVPASHSGCAPAEGFQVAAETRAFLAAQGVDLSGEQQTKTALEYFSQNLTAAARRDRRSGRLSRRNAHGPLPPDR